MAKLLVINLGGSSSKLAIYDNKKCLADKSIQHTQEEMAANPLSKQQVAYRSSLIKAWMNENGYDITDFDAIAIRATPIKQAVHGGTYKIEGRYRELVLEQYFPDQKPVHGTRLAVPVAETLMGDHKIPMYVTDPGGYSCANKLSEGSGPVKITPNENAESPIISNLTTSLPL